jgi:hypothetical protein
MEEANYVLEAEVTRFICCRNRDGVRIRSTSAAKHIAVKDNRLGEPVCVIRAPLTLELPDILVVHENADVGVAQISDIKNQ